MIVPSCHIEYLRIHPRNRHRGTSIYSRSITHLAERVLSPAIQLIAANNGADMPGAPAGSDSGDSAGQPADIHGNCAVYAKNISPAFHPAVDDRASMPASTGDSAYPTPQAYDIDGEIAVCSRVVSQLSIPVFTPALQAGTGDGAGMVVSGCDSGYTTGQPTDINWRGAERIRAIAQLAAVITPPAFHPAAVDSACMLIPGCDGCHPTGQASYLNWQAAAGSGSVAQFAGGIRPPAFYAASTGKCAGMQITHGNCSDTACQSANVCGNLVDFVQITRIAPALYTAGLGDYTGLLPARPDGEDIRRRSSAH